jgi:hypothetical protein
VTLKCTVVDSLYLQVPPPLVQLVNAFAKERNPGHLVPPSGTPAVSAISVSLAHGLLQLFSLPPMARQYLDVTCWALPGVLWRELSLPPNVICGRSTSSTCLAPTLSRGRCWESKPATPSSGRSHIRGKPRGAQKGQNPGKAKATSRGASPAQMAWEWARNRECQDSLPRGVCAEPRDGLGMTTSVSEL